MAAGILAIGFMLVATIFPVGLKLTTMATERTVAGVVLDEALAKIKIFGVDPNTNNLPVNRTVYFNRDTSNGYNGLYTRFSGTPAEIEALVVDFVHLYPSTDIADNKKYSWSALLRRAPDNTVLVIIFVSRKTNISSRYPRPQMDLGVPANYGIVSAGDIDWPMPVRVGGLFCPLASGVCLRCFPVALYPALVRHEARRSGYLHVYLHPWELSRRSRDFAGLAPGRRLYFNVGRRGAYAKFRRFVRDLAFASVAEQMESIRRMAAEARSLDEITCYRAAYTRSKWSYSESFLALLRHFAS